jgi:NAD(P)-dependent dehydrogenase (short-subunit alcohol dehydrogenase family)
MTSSENRLIVVTGGGGGIGRATALLCAKRGDRVAILDKNGESAYMTGSHVFVTEKSLPRGRSAYDSHGSLIA